jgi:glycolate oxidase subunit GlcD
MARAFKVDSMTGSTPSWSTALAEIVGNDWVLTGADDLEKYGKDWTRQYKPAPGVIVLPKTIEEVQAIVRLANERGFSIVPSGGRTGLSGGAVARNGEAVVALDRMNAILDFNAADRQVTCEPGVITEQLQQFAEERGLFYPVDFASSGSSQLGGNVATNAGGIKVIRYGMTRRWIEGMKVVTGKGDLLDLNRGLTKNATGYDLRHLFIGSEGTLGIVVELTIALEKPPKDPTVLVLGVEDMASTMPVLEAFHSKLNLTAFEFFSDKALAHVMKEKNLQKPFESDCSYYTLIEFEQLGEQDLETAMELFEHCLEEGWIVDGTISQNLTQAQNLWRLREDISETIAQFTPYKNDISVKVSAVPGFLKDVDQLVSQAYPDFEIIWFGHIGDGNVHLNILKPDALQPAEFFEKCGKVSDFVFEIVKKYGGSISAEHGVGLLKKPFLHYSRSAEEIAYMHAIKQAFDPNNVMNPGKLLDS